MKYTSLSLCLTMLAGSLSAYAQEATPATTQTPTTTEASESLGEQIQSLQEQIDVLKDSLNEPEGSIQTNINDVKKLKTIKVSGYVQARYVNGTTATGKNTLTVRRARVKVAGSPTDNTLAVLQLDAAGSSVVAKDAYIAYTLGTGDPGRNYSVALGQYLLPFGYMLVQSSSVRETPEFPNVVAKLFPSDYDRGVKISTPTDNRLFAEAGLFNGTGANTNDTNNAKDIVGRVRYKVNDFIDAGTSAYVGKTFAAAAGSAPAADVTKTRFGVDAQVYLHNTTLKAEYLFGEDLFTRAKNDTITPNQSVNKWGYYAQIAHNVTKRDTAVLMYDVFQDRSPSVQSASGTGKLTSYNIGWIHALDAATRVKLFYQINNEENTAVKNNTVTLELITVF